MCAYIPLFVGGSLFYALFSAVSWIMRKLLQLGRRAQRTELQSREERRRLQLKIRKQQKRHFKHFARCRRHWRDLSSKVYEKHGLKCSILCSAQLVRLVLILHYVSCYLVLVALGTDRVSLLGVLCTTYLATGCHLRLTSILLEYWARRVCDSAYGADPPRA